MLKKLAWICMVLFPIYAVLSVIRTKAMLKGIGGIESAPEWTYYIGLALECLLFIALLIVFAILAKKLPGGSLPAWAVIARWIGCALIVGIGFYFGLKWLGLLQTAKLVSILCSVFHTLFYVGAWLMITELLTLLIKKN